MTRESNRKGTVSHWRTRAIAPLLAPCLGLVLSAPAAADKTNRQEANSDMATAIGITDGYWRTHWSTYFTGNYSPPQVVGLYDSRLTQLTCGGAAMPSNNAWYCASEDYVAFELSFMKLVYSLGDGFIYLVVAHEWGHAIQARLRPDLQSVAYELQADCLSGAVLYGAAKAGTLHWEAGDSQEVANTLTAVADQYPWARTEDHGNAQQRIAAFNAGKSGPAACMK